MKPLEAQVQIHRLAKRYREISDIPYKSTDEKAEEDKITLHIRTIIKDVKFKNEIDQADFSDFVEKQLVGIEFELPEPEGTKIHDEPLTEELKQEPVQTINPIAQQRQKKENLEAQINDLKKRKDHFELVAKKERLKKEVEAMEEKTREQQKEDGFFTTKKNKEGLSTFKNEKYLKVMDDFNMDKLILEQELATKDPKKDEEEIKTIEEAIKLVNKKKRKLKMIKVTNYMGQAMVKIPRWINKGTKSIQDITHGMGSMGSQFGKMGNVGQGGDEGDFMVGRDGGKGNDFGFNQSNMFGSGKPKEQKEKKKKRKKKKKKHKKKK